MNVRKNKKAPRDHHATETTKHQALRLTEPPEFANGGEKEGGPRGTLLPSRLSSVAPFVLDQARGGCQGSRPSQGRTRQLEPGQIMGVRG